MVLLFLVMACGTGEPETAEEWCEVARERICECDDAASISDCATDAVTCADRVAAHAERWGAAFALDFQTCLAEHPCPEEWPECEGG